MTSVSRPLVVFLLAMSAMVLLSQCEDATGPAPADRISIDAGDNQYWLKGTELPSPLTVLVLTEDGSVPEESYVRFSVVQGGGTLSSSRAKVNKNGRASVRLTLGDTTGINVVAASLEDASDKSVIFKAIGSNYYCPEKSDTLQVDYGSRGEIFQVTSKSGLYVPDRGVVRLTPVPPDANAFARIPIDGIIEPVVWDAAFSPRGDFYVMRSLLFYELMKIGTDGTVTRFAGLDDISEIAECPSGLVAGCDEKGPFIVQCRDQVVRFAEATYTGGVNNDALAVDRRRQIDDPLGEDIYYIYKPDSTLRRLPLDSLTVEGPAEIVAQLTYDEAQFARGMDTDGNGNVFMVVSSASTKKLLKFEPNGARTELFDFFTEAEGDTAGMLSDLVVNNVVLYTIDTFNDNLIAFDINTSTYKPLFADSIQQAKISTRGSDGSLTGGERVGLALLK